MRVAVRRKNVLDNRGDPKWRPLRVTARMGEPIIHYEDGLHLDGILSYGAFRLMEDKARLPPVGATDWPIDFRLPVAKWVAAKAIVSCGDERLLTVDGHPWGWCCSAAIASWAKRSTHHVRKKPAVEKMAEYTMSPSFHLGLGHMKAYNLPFPTCFAHSIAWFVLGDIAGVERMLAEVTHLGKKTNHGNGKVLQWLVEEVEDDLSIWNGDKLMRRMPATVEGAQGRFVGLGTIRPPYYHHSRRTLCVEADP